MLVASASASGGTLEALLSRSRHSCTDLDANSREKDWSNCLETLATVVGFKQWLARVSVPVGFLIFCFWFFVRVSDSCGRFFVSVQFFLLLFLTVFLPPQQVRGGGGGLIWIRPGMMPWG